MRSRDIFKYVQIVTTILILLYFLSFLTRKTDKVADKPGKKVKAENKAFTDEYVTEEMSDDDVDYTQSSTTTTTTTTTEMEEIDDTLAYKRLDTIPEQTEDLPFLPNYKAPCWEEEDEIFTTELKLKCLPYFYVIGVSHCGTKKLFDQLVKHPLISGNHKAGNRWLTRLRFAGFPNLSDYLQFYYHAVEMDIKRITTEDGYHNAIFGDYTPSIIWDNHNLIGEAKKQNLSEPPYTHADVIKHLNPNARIIALLCNPTERLYDDYVNSAHNDPQTAQIDLREFHEFVARSINKMSDCLQNNTFKKCVYFGKPWASTYTAAGLARLEIGLYQIHLENFFKVFPRKQILILRKEDFYRDPIATLQQVFDFLDVGDITDPEVLEDIRASELEETWKYRKNFDMLPQTRKMIQDFYAPYNDRLVQMLGNDFDYNGQNKRE